MEVAGMTDAELELAFMEAAAQLDHEQLCAVVALLADLSESSPAE